MLHSNNKIIKKYCKINDKDVNDFYNDVFMERQIGKTTEKQECDMFMAKNNDELYSMSFPESTVISTVENINEINKKNRLWQNLVDKWGRKLAGQIIPPTFNILQKAELRRFAVDYLYQRGTYILKNEQESARGILVSNNLKDMTTHITNKKHEGFPVTVVQRIIKSFLINKHAFKIRMYLLIKCDKKTGKKHFYLHNLGGIFYAPEKYSNKNVSNNNIIANGYWYNSIAQTDYVSFISDKPRNLQQLWRHFDKMDIDSRDMMRKIQNLLILIFKSVEDKLYKTKKNDQFCILGFDIMIDEDLKPWIIEFNKGPSTKNYDDSLVYKAKRKVWRDMYNLVEGKDNNFIEIYTT